MLIITKILGVAHWSYQFILFLCVEFIFKKILFHLLLCLHFVTATPPVVHEFRILEPEPIENIYGKDKLRLECTVSGNPLPVVEWSFDGEKFEEGKPFRSADEFAPIYHEISGMGKLAVKVFFWKIFCHKERV